MHFGMHEDPVDCDSHIQCHWQSTWILYSKTRMESRQKTFQPTEELRSGIQNVHGAFQDSIRDLGTLRSKLEYWTQTAKTVKSASR
jgi:hypothetical protein